MVPGLLCTLLVGSSLSSRGLGKLEVVVGTVLPGVGWDGLHVEATTIHGRVLGSRSLLILRHLDVKSARLVLVEQIIKLVVGSTVQSGLVVVTPRTTVGSAELGLVAQDSFIIP